MFCLWRGCRDQYAIPSLIFWVSSQATYPPNPMVERIERYGCSSLTMAVIGGAQIELKTATTKPNKRFEFVDLSLHDTNYVAAVTGRY